MAGGIGDTTRMPADDVSRPTVKVPRTECVSALRPAEQLAVSAKAAYAVGGVTDIFGHWLYHSLANQVFVTYLKLSPTQLSTALFTSRLVDAFTDPFFGWLSDNTRSKWGRRRPFILFGSLAAGLALPCLFMVSPAWNRSTIFGFMVVSACLYAPLISAYNTSYQTSSARPS
jgi:GPH family glycoside/pentoside/hexuronide:cation symporter